MSTHTTTTRKTRRVVHFLTSSEAMSTACGIKLYGRSHGYAPVCSTNREHVTCSACQEGRS